MGKLEAYVRRSWDGTLPCSALVSVTCGPLDGSLAGSSVHGMLQARTLKWIINSFCRGSSQPRDSTWVSCISCINRQILYPWSTRETVQDFLRKWRGELPCDSVVSLLGIYSNKPKTIPKEISTSLFVSTLLTRAKIWKQL